VKTLVFTNISELVTMAEAARKEGRGVQDADLSIISNAAIVVKDGLIAWVGPKQKLTAGTLKAVVGRGRATNVDLQGRSVVPGFVESHTHLVFAGDRAQEFEWRNQGKTYQEISAQGGGIRSTMSATRKAPPAALQKLAQCRVDRFTAQGVTTLEIKSGYGLSMKDEKKCLQVAGRLTGPEIVRTFLGPHSLPPEFDTTQSYLDHLMNQILPEIARLKLAERVDIFVEQGFFSVTEANRWFQAARALGLESVAHVDQLSSGGGAKWAASQGATSVDHFIHLSSVEIQSVAKSPTTVVLLPTSDFYLKMAYPPARTLIDAGARVALATDFNPGTSPTQDLSLVGVLARLEMKMTLAEVLCAYTINGAYALSRNPLVGSLEVGKRCDLAVVDGSWRDLFYQVGLHPIESTWRNGVRLN
jgi:imidazolonepropionase